jgi:hypothetical protein
MAAEGEEKTAVASTAALQVPLQVAIPVARIVPWALFGVIVMALAITSWGPNRVLPPCSMAWACTSSYTTRGTSWASPATKVVASSHNQTEPAQQICCLMPGDDGALEACSIRKVQGAELSTPQISALEAGLRNVSFT